MDCDGLFTFRELDYGLVPSQAGAAFGLGQLEKRDAPSARRSARFESQQVFCREHEDVFITPRVLDDVVITWIWDRSIATCMIFSGNVTRQPMLRGLRFRADPKGLPNADRIMAQGVMLPCHPTVTDDDCAYLDEAIESFVSARTWGKIPADL